VQSLFRIGVIKFERLFDLDGALEALNRIAKISNKTNMSYEASLKIGEVQIARNDLAGAREEYGKLRNITLSFYKHQAEFRLAEIDYFESRFDSALSLLEQFNVNLSTDLANDALQLQYFIQENTGIPQALREFAGADLLMRQRKNSEAIIQFQDIVKRYPSAMLIDDAMMKIGELHIRLQQPNDAIAIFSYIVDSVQMSILKDRAQFRIAEVYNDMLKNKEQAISAYENLLVRFPNSLYAEESRKRIRLLRGDPI
jgi:outer membrane protein assembly factor BamD (BamD/ComL family)